MFFNADVVDNHGNKPPLRGKFLYLTKPLEDCKPLIQGVEKSLLLQEEVQEGFLYAGPSKFRGHVMVNDCKLRTFYIPRHLLKFRLEKTFEEML